MNSIDKQNQLLAVEPAVMDTLFPRSSGAYAQLRQHFIAVVVAQMLMLVVFAVPKAYTLSTGRIVTLQAQPVDPWDMFRGEYATLSYKDLSRFDTRLPFKQGDDIYVSLSGGTPVWQIVSISRTAPVAVPGQVVLKGKVSNAPWPMDKGGSRTINVEYGIERIYTPEGKSAALQREMKDVTVNVAVDSFGHGCIKQVRLGDRKFYDGTNMLNPFN